ncbi:hypothetical protein TNCV_237761 [Trichonephila clavipes]|nr:hypothetical protein TNCV_237761 [Trichonephila clavipes]
MGHPDAYKISRKDHLCLAPKDWPHEAFLDAISWFPLVYWMQGSIDKTATAGSDVFQSGRPIFDAFFQHLWPYIGNDTANVVFQMVKRLWLIRIDQ